MFNHRTTDLDKECEPQSIGDYERIGLLYQPASGNGRAHQHASSPATFVDDGLAHEEAPILCNTIVPPLGMEHALETSGYVVDEGEITKKLHMHLLTRFFALTLFNYLDRTNLSLAAVQMNERLGITDEQYGFGSGVFYIGYMLSQVPSNMMLERVGAPVWLAVIVVSWGIVASCFAFIKKAWHFYLLRVLLGITEGGTFPGMWYHMTLFYTDTELGAAYSVVLLGISVSQVVGSPLAAGLLKMDGFLGVQGWQWLFILEGLPTILLGLWLRTSLARSPLHCNFLTMEQRNWVMDRAAQERKRKAEYGAKSNRWGAVKEYRTWWLTGSGAMYATAKFGVMYWCPLIIQQLYKPLAPAPAPAQENGSGDGRPDDALVSLINTLPFTFASLAMIANSWHSKRTDEVRYHATLPMLVTALAFALMPWLMQLGKIPATIGLVASTAMYSTEAIWMSWPARFLQGKAAATGVALINSLANLGGLAGPVIMGFIKSHTTSGGGFAGSMIIFAVLLLAVFCALFCFPLPGEAQASDITFTALAQPNSDSDDEFGLELGQSGKWDSTHRRDAHDDRCGDSDDDDGDGKDDERESSSLLTRNGS